MYPDTGRSPLDLTRLPGLELVADLVYNPYRTALLAQAEALGIKAVNGLRMLAAQGLRASELFTGRTLPLSLIDKATDRLAAELNGAPDAAKEVGGRKLMFMVLNGPNINMLGVREPEVYGKRDYRTLLDEIETWAAELGVAVRCYQSNHEGELVDLIQAARGQFDGIVINPAAYTHTSVAILDALKAAGLPAVEVHISDVAAREPFRQVSYAGMACIKTYAGLGFEGYRRAMEYLKAYILGTENDAEKRELVEDRGRAGAWSGAFRVGERMPLCDAARRLEIEKSVRLRDGKRSRTVHHRAGKPVSRDLQETQCEKEDGKTPSSFCGRAHHAIRSLQRPWSW